MNIDLDELASDAVAAAPTRTPDVGTLRDRVSRRRRKRRVLTGVVATPLVALVAVGAWAMIDQDNSTTTQVVAAGGTGENPDATVGPTAAAPGLFRVARSTTRIRRPRRAHRRVHRRGYW